MKSLTHLVSLLVLGCWVLTCWVLLCGCYSTEKVPETGRTRRQLRYSESEMEDLGAQAYRDAIQKYKVITGTPEAAMVERTGKKLAAACGKNYNWEFRLLEAPKTINAFCLPGGKVAVFSGIV